VDKGQKFSSVLN